MTNISKGKRSFGSLKTMDAHNEFLNRITKSLYYSKLPITDRLSLPITEFAVELFSEVKSGCSLERLDAEEASRISRNACVSPCSFVLALLYLERLKDCNPEYLFKVAPSELFLVSLMIASKFLNDDGEEDEVFNTEWAKSGELTVGHINRLEKEFLDAINWTIYVYDKDFWDRLQKLERDIAYIEAKKRGWFSYTELSCLMDTKLLTSVIHALIRLSLICLATYTAGVFMLLSSAIITSHIPGTSLSARQSFRSVTTNNIEILINAADESRMVEIKNFSNIDECPNCYLTIYKSCNIVKPSVKILNVNLGWWLNTAITWLVNDLTKYGIKINELRNSNTFITNNESPSANCNEWKDLIVEIDWIDTLNKNSKYLEDWEYYANYITKITLGHQH